MHEHASGPLGQVKLLATIEDITSRRQDALRQEAIAAAQLAIAEIELSPQTVMREICRHALALTDADFASLEMPEAPT